MEKGESGGREGREEMKEVEGSQELKIQGKLVGPMPGWLSGFLRFGKGVGMALRGRVAGFHEADVVRLLVVEVADILDVEDTIVLALFIGGDGDVFLLLFLFICVAFFVVFLVVIVMVVAVVVASVVNTFLPDKFAVELVKVSLVFEMLLE